MDHDTAPTRGDQDRRRATRPPPVSEALKQLAAASPSDTAEFERALSGLAKVCAEAPAEALELLVAAATSAPEAMLRRAGIEGLGIFGPDAVAHAPIIVAALSDSDPDVRAAAPSSLSTVLRRNEPEEKLRAAVRRAVEQSSSAVRQAGRQAAGTCPE
ncbi:HEAT repeat domain-containing protein [Streptomyces sp. c-19]|uniref:HEAT repeat domain-containing protein n=1 Tax=Streptomyces sp. c-19 TaxID=2789275 RepID=UPI00397F6E2F